MVAAWAMMCYASSIPYADAGRYSKKMLGERVVCFRVFEQDTQQV